jgi:hypothetical protein
MSRYPALCFRPGKPYAVDTSMGGSHRDGAPLLTTCSDASSRRSGEDHTGNRTVCLVLMSGGRWVHPVNGHICGTHTDMALTRSMRDTRLPAPVV